MANKKILLLTPFLITAGLLIYCWSIILFTEVIATWRHYLGLILFIGLSSMVFESNKKNIIGTGVYLVLGTFNLIVLTPAITTNAFGFGSGTSILLTPDLQLLPFGVLTLLLVLNYDKIIDRYLDFKKGKNNKK